MSDDARRLRTLHALSARMLDARSEDEMFARLEQVLAESEDVGAALVYLGEPASAALRLAVKAGDVPDLAAPPTEGADDARRRARDIVVPLGEGFRLGFLAVRPNPRLPLDAAYREFLGLLGEQLAAALRAVRERDRARSDLQHVLAAAATREASGALEKIRFFAESGRQLFWIASPEGWIDWYSDSWYAYTGQTYEEAAGWGWRAVHHPADFHEVMRRWPESLANGTPFEMSFRLRGRDGEYRWFLTRAVPERDAAGAVTAWYGTNHDIDAERRASEHLAFLSRFGRRLFESVGNERILENVTDALVPEFADVALVHLLDERGELRLRGVRHAEPARDALLQQLLESGDPRAAGGSVASAAMAAGEPLVFARLDPGEHGPAALGAFDATLRALAVRSAAVIPIVGRGTIRGAFCALATRDDRRYSPRDLPFYEEIGRRVGTALENAEAYARERRVARAFQDAALPGALPVIPGIRLSALYEPAAAEARVGGDFYDAFRLLDGRLVVSIGDVAGSGLEAAATMAAVRQSVRAAASINPDPDLMLKAADGVFSDPERAPFASAFVAVVDPLTYSLRYASAGHPAPALRTPDGEIVALDEPGGTLLGVDAGETGEARPVVTGRVPDGALLVLYTDGLTEAERRPLDGERRLHDALRDGTPGDAARLREAVMGAASAAHDDVAMLTIRFDRPLLQSGNGRVRRWSFPPGDAARARSVRGEIAETLAGRGFGEEELFAAEMIFAELLGNVVRYVPTGDEVEVALDLTQESPVLHILDTGPGFYLNPKLPSDAYSERGRGLFIVTRLAREFTASPRTATAGSHARAVLRGQVRGRGRLAVVA